MAVKFTTLRLGCPLCVCLFIYLFILLFCYLGFFCNVIFSSFVYLLLYTCVHCLFSCVCVFIYAAIEFTILFGSDLIYLSIQLL